MSLSPRERRIFECFADTVLAPAPPLPPVRETDALTAFDGWLAHAPRLNRTGLRAALLALEGGTRLTAGARWRHLAPTARLDVLRRIERRGGRALVEALRACAALSYYGDPRVSALVGYVPGPVRR